MKHVGRYLHETRTKGIIFKPNKPRAFEVYTDANFSGNYNKLDVPNLDMACSHTGYVVFYCGCHVILQSKLQTEIALSMIEAEIISLSTTLKTTIPLMEIAENSKLTVLTLLQQLPLFLARYFEDNSRACQIDNDIQVSAKNQILECQIIPLSRLCGKRRNPHSPLQDRIQTADILTKSLDVPNL